MASNAKPVPKFLGHLDQRQAKKEPPSNDRRPKPDPNVAPGHDDRDEPVGPSRWGHKPGWGTPWPGRNRRGGARGLSSVTPAGTAAGLYASFMTRGKKGK